MSESTIDRAVALARAAAELASTTAVSFDEALTELARAAGLIEDSATLGRVRDYATRCAILRMEPSTNGLRRVLSQEAT